MKKTGIFITILLMVMLIAGCAGEKPADYTPGLEQEGSAVAGPLTGNASGNQTGLLTAEPGEFGSMQLKWEAMENADRYLLELQTGGEEYLPVAGLKASTLSYEDADLAAETTYTYRLTGLKGNEKLDTWTATATTLPAVIDPLTVTLEFDQTQPAFDLTNFDPDNFDPSMFENLFPTDEAGGDAGSFDPSMFMATPVTESKVIGPSGGEISVTASSGIVYTLTVPEGALLFEVPIKLSPISAIPDLPLSGGMDGAVLIEPEGIPLLAPATLTIFAPEGFTPTSGELSLGFSFEGEGGEFHLYPLVEEDAQARAAAHRAKPVEKPKVAGPLAEIAQQQLDQFAGFGKGSGSKEDVKKVSKRPPAKAKNKAAAGAAAAKQAGKFIQPVEDAFDEELTPLMTPQELALAKLGESVRQMAERANDWGQLMDALDEFQAYYQNGGSKFNKQLNDRILDALVKATYNLLQKNMGKCLAADDLKAQALVENLVNGKGAAIKAISARFKEKYGNKLLDDVYNGMKPCTYELEFKSSLSFESDGSVFFTTTEVAPFPLFPVYAAGDLFLFGSGLMNQTKSISGTCTAPASQYDDLKFVAQKLEPEFDSNGLLVDFALTRYYVSGMKQLGGVDVAGDECMRSISFQGGGDFWSAFFTMSRATNGQFELRNWDVKGDILNGSSVTAKWESIRGSFSPKGGGKMSEDSKFTLRINKIK